MSSEKCKAWLALVDVELYECTEALTLLESEVDFIVIHLDRNEPWKPINLNAYTIYLHNVNLF